MRNNSSYDNLNDYTMDERKINTQLDFVSVQVRDLQKSEKFYREVLGFNLANYQNPEAVVFQNGVGAIFAIRQPFTSLPKDQPLGLGVSIWFGWKGQVDQLIKYFQDKEVKVLTPPYDTPFGRSITIADPDGYAITLHQIDTYEN